MVKTHLLMKIYFYGVKKQMRDECVHAVGTAALLHFFFKYFKAKKVSVSKDW